MTRVAKFVALETSSEWCSVALSLDGEISSRERRAGQRHSELALPMLFELLRDTSLKIEDIEAVAYGAGPGSFTGLRIACGLARLGHSDLTTHPCPSVRDRLARPRV